MEKQFYEKKKRKENLKKKLTIFFKTTLKEFLILNSTGLFLIPFLKEKVFLLFFIFNYIFFTALIQKLCHQYPNIEEYLKLKHEIENQEYFLENEQIFELINEKKENFQKLEPPITLESSTSYKLTELKKMKDFFLTYEVNQITGDYPQYKTLKKEKK